MSILVIKWTANVLVIVLFNVVVDVLAAHGRILEAFVLGAHK